MSAKAIYEAKAKELIFKYIRGDGHDAEAVPVQSQPMAVVEASTDLMLLSASNPWLTSNK